MKEVEKYVGLYLLVYFTVLVICGFFQYVAVCQGKSLECSFSMSGINTIITTTAYVLTPIVAIIGFLSWKSQHNIKIYSDYANEVLIKYEQVFDLMLNINKLHKYTESKILSLNQNTLLTPKEKNEAIEILINEMKRNFYDEIRKIEALMDRLIQKSVFLGYLAPDSISVSEKSVALKKEFNIIIECMNKFTKENQFSHAEGFQVIEGFCCTIFESAERNIQPCLTEIKKFIEV
jgi:hypothetical protein